MFPSASWLGSSRPTGRGRAALAVGAAVALAGLIFGPAPAVAQQGTAPVQRSYINPFPNGDRYRVIVLGDSLGDGLWSGLYRAFEEDTNLEFIQRAKAATGFARTNSYDWNKELADLLKTETYQIAIVMFGGIDGQMIRSGKDWLKVGSEPWREIYGQRVEAFIKQLRAANIAIYWVGLPIMRSAGQNADAEALNDVFREQSFINGAKFVETWNGFTDEAGRYSPYGPDMTGQVKRLRADDGVHFTMRGYLKLAHFVEKELRRDLNLAKIERNIPLAGNEDEQAKVMGRDVVAGSDDPAQPAAPAETEAAPEAGGARGTGARRGGASASAKQRRRGERCQARDRSDAPGGAKPLPARGASGRARRRNDHERARQRVDRRRHHLLGHRPVARFVGAAAAAVAAALLQSPDQGRTAQAQGRPGRRFRLAPRLSGISGAGRSCPSGTCRWRAPPGGLRGSPTPRATDPGACRLRRRSWSARCDSRVRRP